MLPRVEGHGPQGARGAAEEDERDSQLHHGDAGENRLGRQRRAGGVKDLQKR